MLNRINSIHNDIFRNNFNNDFVINVQLGDFNDEFEKQFFNENFINDCISTCNEYEPCAEVLQKNTNL